MRGEEFTCRSYTHIMWFSEKEVDDLTSKEMSSFADADLEFTRGSLLYRGIGVLVFRTDNIERFYAVRSVQMKGVLLSVPKSTKENARRRPSNTTKDPWK
jgi:hypothetical protein